jgi:hypothetical protein
MFQRSQALFQENKDMLQRKNYPSAQFVAYKLALHLGIDLSKWIKLPKLKATRDRIEADWEYIDPINF